MYICLYIHTYIYIYIFALLCFDLLCKASFDLRVGSLEPSLPFAKQSNAKQSKAKQSKRD